MILLGSSGLMCATRSKATKQKGLRRRNSPTCTLSQNGYGDGSVAQHGTTSNAKVTQKDRRLGSCVGGFSLVALSLTVAPPGTPAQVLAFRIDTHKRQATWATPSHGPPAGRGFDEQGFKTNARLPSLLRKLSWQKAGSTLRSSRAVPHPSTNRALRRLTSEVGRDPVHSTRYGRQR